MSAKQHEIEKELETLSASLAAVQRERDEAVAANEAKEAQLRQEHSIALEKLAAENKTKLEELHTLTKANMDNMNKMHEQHSQDHEANLQKVLASHQEELQGLKSHHEVQLESQEREHKKQLEEKVKSLETGSTNAQEDAAALQELEDIKKELQKVKVC